MLVEVAKEEQRRVKGVAASERPHTDMTKWTPSSLVELTASSVRMLKGGPLESVKGPVVEWNSF